MKEEKNELVIEKGIPIPKHRYGYGSFIDKIKEMKIGDSVVVDHNKAAYMRGLLKRIGFRFTQRKINQTQSRIWRIE